jgi:hypothetical protein
MLLNNSGNYHVKGSNKKVKKKGYTSSANAKHSTNSGWEMLAHLSSSSRERKYQTNKFTKTKNKATNDIFKDLPDNKNTTHYFKDGSN